MMEWINVEDRMPEPGKKVIAFFINEYGKPRRIMAEWIPKYFMEGQEDSYEGDLDYDEEGDTYYWPEGWYESNEFEETHWMVGGKITHWMELPNGPEINAVKDN